MAARTEQRRFGSFALDPTNGIILTTWRTRALHSAKFADRIAADGAVALTDRFRGQRVDIGGNVMGSDTGDARDKLEALISALMNGEQNLRLYSDRQLQCRLLSDVRHDLVNGSAGLVYAFSASFRSRLPWWEGTTTTSGTTAVSGAGPHGIAVASPGASAPTFPTIKIQNTGPAFTDEVITLTNTNTAEQVQLLGLSMNAGQSVWLDMLEGWLGDGSSATPVSPFAIDGTFWALQANAATNIEIAHTVGASAAWSVTVSYTPAFWFL